MEDIFQHIVFHPFTGRLAVQTVVLAVLLLLSAIASGSEAAFFSLSPGDMDTLKKSSGRGSSAALKLLAMPEYLLATILIINNLVNICAVILANFIIDGIVTFTGLPALEFIVKVVLVTFMLLLFGEIMPKVFATYNRMKIVAALSVPFLFLKSILKPLSWLLISTSGLVKGAVAVKKANISIDELSNAIEITTDQTQEEKKILSGIVSFTSTEVDEIMCPRVDMVTLDIEDGYPQVKETVVSSGFSRIPVYEESIDRIKGILYVKDLIQHLDAGNGFHWQKLIRKPYFVPDHKKINDLFAEFQKNRVHIAIVVDEYGSTQGLITLEDILEEIVGEISDESDAMHPYYTRISQNIYIFDGKTHLIDFLKIAGLDDNFFDGMKGEAESLAGLMLEVKRDFLKEGETLYFGHLSLTAESVKNRRIDKVRAVLDQQWRS